MSVSNILMNHLEKCYQLLPIPMNAPQKILEPLKWNCLILSDIEILSKELPALCRFLSSKQAMLNLEAIIINKTSAKSNRDKKIQISKAGHYSALSLEGSKLLIAALNFISTSSKLHTIVLENISINLKILSQLGSSLSVMQHGLKSLTLKGIRVGDEGLRILSPHLSVCKYQCLSLEKCDLTDGSLPSLIGIVKSQEAIQDNNYWNASLRLNPEDAYEIPTVTPAMITLDLSKNHFTKRAAQVISNLMNNNQWILGLNLSDNKIDKDGISILIDTFATNSNNSSNANTMLALPLHKNPGLSDQAVRTLLYMAAHNDLNPVFASLPVHVTNTLKKWISQQKDVLSYSNSKSKDRTMHHKRAVMTENTEYYQNHPHFVPTDGHILSHGRSEQLKHAWDHDDDSAKHEMNDGDSDIILTSGANVRDIDAIDLSMLANNGKDSHRDYLDEFGFQSGVDLYANQGVNGRPPSRNSLRPRQLNNTYPSVKSSEHEPHINGHLSRSGTQYSDRFNRSANDLNFTKTSKVVNRNRRSKSNSPARLSRSVDSRFGLPHRLSRSLDRGRRSLSESRPLRRYEYPTTASLHHLHNFERTASPYLCHRSNHRNLVINKPSNKIDATSGRLQSANVRKSAEKKSNKKTLIKEFSRSLAYVQQELLDVSQQLRSLTESMNNSRIDQHSFTSGRVGESGTSNGHQFTNMSMSDLSPNNKRSTDTSRSHVIPSPIRYVESSVMQSPQPFAEKKNQLDENIINAMIKESLKEKLTQLITVAKDQYFQNTPT